MPSIHSFKISHTPFEQHLGSDLILLSLVEAYIFGADHIAFPSFISTIDNKMARTW